MYLEQEIIIALSQLQVDFLLIGGRASADVVGMDLLAVEKYLYAIVAS